MDGNNILRIAGHVSSAIISSSQLVVFNSDSASYDYGRVGDDIGKEAIHIYS